MPDESDETELTDDELRDLIAFVAETHLPNPEERRAIVDRLRPEIEAAVRQTSMRPTLGFVRPDLAHW